MNTLINLNRDKRHLAARIIIIAVCFLAADRSLSAEMFDGPILFKGELRGNALIGGGFNITIDDKKTYKIECRSTGNRFNWDSGGMILRDIAVSANENHIALLGQSENWKSPDMILISMSKDGVSSEHKFKLNNLIPGYGWVVELAAISNNGESMLAKCAKIRFNEGKAKLTGHEWVLLTASKGNISAENSKSIEDRFERAMEID